ncbi:hypothetical protein HRG_005205 [Hirsutella rhossiliensis]|uniref:Uncharacterized protein n=1 Tax=Hirsutella rhossiliensis TaxID=111463 RepID=A0A9P8MWS6_9HYPO|nr:uncharacterized protein HRG_05205 [Hirsutella rhossiliensis]KAH0962695.1 hypothetical protein HRG_05205 [Hirsutella rhossiliensis]
MGACGEKGPQGIDYINPRPEGPAATSRPIAGLPGYVESKAPEKDPTWTGRSSINLEQTKIASLQPTAGTPDIQLQTPTYVLTAPTAGAKPKETTTEYGVKGKTSGETTTEYGVKGKTSAESNLTRVPEKQVEDIMLELTKCPCEIRGGMFSIQTVPEQAQSLSIMLVVDVVEVNMELQRRYHYEPCEPHYHGHVVSVFQGHSFNGFVQTIKQSDSNSCRLRVEGNKLTDVVIQGSDVRQEPVPEKAAEERLVLKCSRGAGSCGEPQLCQGDDECMSNLVLKLEVKSSSTGSTTMTTGSVFKPCQSEAQCQCIRACAGEQCVDQKPVLDVVAARTPVPLSEVMTNPPLERMLDTIAENVTPQTVAPDSPQGAPAPPGGRLNGTGVSTPTNSSRLGSDKPGLKTAGSARTGNAISVLTVVAASALALLF